MKRNVLIYASESYPQMEELEKVLLSRGFRTVRVNNRREAAFRVENEIFSVVICIDSADGSCQTDLASSILDLPFGAITPAVVLSAATQPASRALLGSLLDQYFPVSTEPEVLADFVSETHDLRSSRAKRGKLGHISVPQLLYQASKFHLSGAIVSEQAEEKCIVYMEDGFVVFASSNRDENRFGEFLVQQRIITRDQFLHAAKLLQKGGKRFGRILVDEGILKPQVLHTLIQSQVKHIIFNVFDWSDGEFYVLLDERSGQDEAISHFDVAPLITEGVSFKFNERALEKEFAPFDQKVSLGLPLQECQARMHLKKNEADFLRLIGSGRAIDELLNLNSYSRLESLKLLYAFRILGFLVFAKLSPEERLPERKPISRSEVLEELFPLKGKPGSRQSSPPLPVAESKGSRRIWLLTGAMASSMVLALLTLFQTRTADIGQTREEVALLRTITPATPKPIESTPTPTPPPPVSDVPTEQASVSPTPNDREQQERFDLALNQGDRAKLDGRLEAAIAHYESALRLKPRSIPALLGIADSLFELNQTHEAAKYYERATRFDSRNPRPYLALGTAYLLAEDKVKAKKAYQQYLDRVTLTDETRARVTEVRKILKSLKNEE